MTQPLRSEDFPDFDTYPGPEAREGAAESSLDSAAEQIGNTVGRAVRAARELPERAEQLRGELRDRLTVIRGGGGRSFSEKAADIKDTAQQKLEEGKERAVRMARQARWRFSRLANEQPLHLLMGIFAAGMIAGVALRLWRSRD